MSLHISVVAVKGNGVEALETLMRQCRYRAVAPPKRIAAWTQLDEALVGPEDKALCRHNGWTTLVDPEFTVMLQDEHLAHLSKTQQTTVLAMICEGVSKTYGFAAFRNGIKIRSLTVSDGTVVETAGEPIPEENALEPESLDETQVLDLLKRLGYDYLALRDATDIAVYSLRFAGEQQADELAKTVELVVDGPPVQIKRRKDR